MDLISHGATGPFSILRRIWHARLTTNNIMASSSDFTTQQLSHSLTRLAMINSWPGMILTHLQLHTLTNKDLHFKP